MPDAIELVRSIKRASIEAVEAAKPVNVCLGRVKSTAPLSIAVDQKLVLGRAQLILTRNVTDYETEVTVEWESKEALTEPYHHAHAVEGRKRLTIHNGLAAGEVVLLLRQQEGQKYVVWDRVKS